MAAMTFCASCTRPLINARCWARSHYVLAVESITLDARLAGCPDRGARASLFHVRPLDPLFADETVSEFVIDGPARVAVRRGLSRRQPDDARFDDTAHLASVMERLLAAGGRDTSLARSSLSAAPYSKPARADQRGYAAAQRRDQRGRFACIHSGPSRSKLCTRSMPPLPAEAGALLGAIVRGGHGLLIVGEPGTGKTALAGALAARLPRDARAIAVERAAELSCVRQSRARQRRPERLLPMRCAPRSSSSRRGWLLVELRGDEVGALWPALAAPSAPRVIGVWRGATQPDRHAQRAQYRHPARAARPCRKKRATGILAASFPFIVALKATGDGVRLAYLGRRGMRRTACGSRR
jgi:hypothetical protein